MNATLLLLLLVNIGSMSKASAVTLQPGEGRLIVLSDMGTDISCGGKVLASVFCSCIVENQGASSEEATLVRHETFSDGTKQEIKLASYSTGFLPIFMASTSCKHDLARHPACR